MKTTKQYLTEAEAYEMFDTSLDELHGGNWLTDMYGAANILKKIDEVAYYQGFQTFCDSLSEDYTIEGYNDQNQ